MLETAALMCDSKSSDMPSAAPRLERNSCSFGFAGLATSVAAATICVPSSDLPATVWPPKIASSKDFGRTWLTFLPLAQLQSLRSVYPSCQHLIAERRDDSSTKALIRSAPHHRVQASQNILADAGHQSIAVFGHVVPWANWVTRKPDQCYDHHANPARKMLVGSTCNTPVEATLIQ